MTVVRCLRAPNPSPLTGPGTNSWLVGRGEVAVIDPGPDLPAHLDALLAALAGERVAAILVTHAHADHSALAPRLAARTGAPVLGFGPPDRGRSPLMQALAGQGLAGGGEGVDAGFSPDRTVGAGDVVEGDWGRLSVLHTPGHFPGHLAFGLGDRLFVGDTVMGWATTLISPPDGDLSSYMATLDRLAAGGWAQFLPGHGDPVDDPAARLAALAAHRNARSAAILAALRSGPADLAALTPRVYADTPPALHPAAARNLLAHLIALHAEGRITARPALSETAVFALA